MERSVLLAMTTGAAVMFGFGIIWLLIGLFRGRPSPAWLRIALLCGGIALGASIATLGYRASSIPRRSAPVSARQLAINREIGRRFYIVLGVEWAAIFVALMVLSALHYADYILCGIGLIVAVHFFPLALLFGAPVYSGTALVGCGISLIGFFMADAGLRQKIVGISFGLLLWGTAAWIAVQGLSVAPRGVRNLPPM